MCIYIYTHTFGIQTKPWRNTLATLAISGSHWNSLGTFKARYFFFRLGFLLSEWSHLNTQIVILQTIVPELHWIEKNPTSIDVISNHFPVMSDSLNMS